MLSILNNFENAKKVTSPFTYFVIENAYPRELFEKYRKIFPTLEAINNSAEYDNNRGYLFDYILLLNKTHDIDPAWNEFFEYHTSEAFFDDVLRCVGDDLSRVNPSLEQFWGKDFGDLPVKIRDKTKDKSEAAIWMDVQFGINSPVTEWSSVRGAHVDSPYKLLNALWYMREEEDDSEGGELLVYRYKKGKPVFEGELLNERDLEEVDRVPYKANTLFLFLNSVWSTHGVAPRNPTSHTRKYINFNIESYKIHNDKLFARPQKLTWVMKKNIKRVRAKIGF